MEEKQKQRPEVTIAKRTAKVITILALLFQIIEPCLVPNHEWKFTSWISLFFLVTFGSYSIISRRK